MKTRLIIVRHAEAEGNDKRVFHGWTDGEITARGRKQAEMVACRLKAEDIDAIYSSSLKRTLQTAQYIADVKGLSVKALDGLREINGGDWEGIGWDVLPGRWPVEYDTWENKPHMHRMPGGESMEELQDRVYNEVMSIVGENEGRSICIVTHGTAIRSLICRFEGCALSGMLNIPWYDNTSVTIAEYESGKFTVSVKGDASHLGKEYSTLENQEWWAEYMKDFINKKGGTAGKQAGGKE